MGSWLYHWLGLGNLAGPVYGWWSGSGSVFLPPLITLAGIAVLYWYHHWTCYRPACFRYVHHLDPLTGRRHCRRHPAPPVEPPADLGALLHELSGLRGDISGLAEAIRASLNHRAR